MQSPRYSLSLLVEASGLSEAALGRAVGLSGTTLKQARTRGLTEAAADRYAIRAGLHPSEVWDDWGLVACLECGTLFAPFRRGHSFCRASCRDRRRMRTKYRTNPAYAEAKRTARRAFYIECGDYERARERERYALRRSA